MIKFYNLCNKYNIKIRKIKIDKSLIFIYSDDKIYLLRKKLDNDDLYDYFNNINFHGYIKSIGSYDEYELCLYYEDKYVDRYGKAKELIVLLSSLHNKSYSYIDFNSNIKEDLYNLYKNKIDECMKYYLKLQDNIEEMDYLLPQYYLLINNISKFYKLLHIASSKLEEFYNLESIHIRDALLVNNLSLDNFCYSDKSYFIDYSLSKKGYIVYDLASFYRSNYFDLDCKSLIDHYDSLMHLNNSEWSLLFLIISIPSIIQFNGSNYDNTIVVRKEINYVEKTLHLLEEYKKN